jgi:hypothetical protein
LLFCFFLITRIYTIKTLKEYAAQIGFNQTKANIIPLLEQLITESEPSIRQTLAGQIPEICKYLMALQSQDSYTLVLHILVPMVAELTTDQDSHVSFLFFQLERQYNKELISHFFPFRYVLHLPTHLLVWPRK